jgi:uncharacterized protein
MGKGTDAEVGYIWAGLRAVNEAESRSGAPVLNRRALEAVPIVETVRYRIPLVLNARRFKAEHRIRLYLTSDDQPDDNPARMMLKHAIIGMSSILCESFDLWCQIVAG